MMANVRLPDIVVGETGKKITISLEYPAGVPFDLTGATAVCKLGYDGQDTVLLTKNCTNEAGGRVSFYWAAADIGTTLRANTAVSGRVEVTRGGLVFKWEQSLIFDILPVIA